MEKPKILICEDEEIYLKSISKFLQKNDMEVYSAFDGEESIKKAAEIKPDVILLDIRMPKIDGLEVAQTIRETNTQVKIIFLTAFESPEVVREAAKYGFSDYIVKPMVPDEILTAIHKALEKPSA